MVEESWLKLMSSIGERGYRYLHLDAGHACQNLYLSAGSVDCGVCAIAAFSDDDMNDLLELDGEERFISLKVLLAD